MEYQILDFITELHNPVLTFLLGALTKAGDNGVLWVAVSVFLICFKKTRFAGVTALLALLLGHIAGNVLIKPFIARERPFASSSDWSFLLIPPPSGYSFPSGHTASSFAAAIVYFLYHKKIGTAALFIAALMAFSRLYFYVHFPTDILGGMALGCLMAYLAAFACEKFKKNTHFF